MATAPPPLTNALGYPTFSSMRPSPLSLAAASSSHYTISSSMRPGPISLAGANASPGINYQQSLRPLQLQRQQSSLASLNRTHPTHGFLSPRIPGSSASAAGHRNDGHSPAYVYAQNVNRAYTQHMNAPYHPTRNSDENSPSAQLIPQLQNHLISGSRDDTMMSIEGDGASPTAAPQRVQMLRQNVSEGVRSRRTSMGSAQQGYGMRQNDDEGMRGGQASSSSGPQGYNFGGSNGAGVGAATYNDFANHQGQGSSSRVGNDGLGNIGRRSEMEDGGEHHE
jgi:hypothetical protein